MGQKTSWINDCNSFYFGATDKETDCSNNYRPDCVWNQYKDAEAEMKPHAWRCSPTKT